MMAPLTDVRMVLALVAGALALVGLLLWLGLRVIREDRSGLVVKKFGHPLAPGRIVALAGEAG